MRLSIVIDARKHINTSEHFVFIRIIRSTDNNEEVRY